MLHCCLQTQSEDEREDANCHARQGVEVAVAVESPLEAQLPGEAAAAAAGWAADHETGAAAAADEDEEKQQQGSSSSNGASAINGETAESETLVIIDEEMAQLQSELPILEEVLKLITSLMGGGAAAKGNTQEILKQAQAKVAGLVPPAADKKLDSSIVRRRRPDVRWEAPTPASASRSRTMQCARSTLPAI